MNNEDKILEILTQMSQRQDSTEKILSQMQSDVSGLKSDVSELKQGQKSLEAKVDNLETKVDGLQQDMNEVKLDVKFIWQELGIHERRIDKIAK